MVKKMEDKNKEERAIPFLEAYPEYDVSNLPFWVRENIEQAVVTGKKYRSILMPDGRRYNMDNKLNHLSGQEWTYFINSVFSTRYPTNGKESYAHKIRKIHPTPKPPQLMRDIILFFTKENEIVFDSFMGVGGTLIGASLCKRRAIGIDLNAEYIEAYKSAVKELGLPEFPAYEGDCISLLKKERFIEDILHNEKISLLLIDPPYANMMSKQKTGADIEVYGKVSTPFTNSELDLGNKEINDFLKSLKQSIELILDYIKNNGHIVIFIKDLQPKNGLLNMLHYDVAEIVNSIKGISYKGMRIWNDETAKLYPYGYPFSFVANQTHQYILIFRKEK